MDHWTISIAERGREYQPVVIIDDFAADPEAWRADAAHRHFEPLGAYYPGVRAPVPEARLAELLAALAPIADDVFGVTDLSLIEALYSIVTTPADALAPIQRLPHFDGLEHERLALLHFLSPDETSGTAFYRHRATGYEYVDAARYQRYDAALRDDLAQHGMPPASYIQGDTPIFEQIAAYQGRFNRALLYRSNALHCALLPAQMPMTADPLHGRLTVNTFLTGVSR